MFPSRSVKAGPVAGWSVSFHVPPPNPLRSWRDDPEDRSIQKPGSSPLAAIFSNGSMSAVSMTQVHLMNHPVVLLFQCVLWHSRCTLMNVRPGHMISVRRIFSLEYM